MSHVEHRFPIYTRAERALDNAVHLVGVPSAVIAASWLLAEVSRTQSLRVLATMMIYAVGLIGMLSASAAYHMAPPSRTKELLRRADHAMIFVMIAGSYTPFALNALQPPGGVVLCSAIWSLALVGIFIKLAFPRRFERLCLALYLGMGWAVLSMLHPLMARLPGTSAELLLAAGLVYSLGALIYTRHGLKYHTATWHALVLLGAALHLAALEAAFLAA